MKLPTRSPLRVVAGPLALAHLRERGLRLEDVDVVVGAAGGTKFLLLGGLDRVLFSALRRGERRRPLHCVGASIGAWRLACAATRDPCAALERLAEAYIEERSYTAPGPRPRYFCSAAARLVCAMLGEEPRAAIAEHASIKLHVLASRCGGLTAAEHPVPLLAGLALAWAGNLMSRRALGWQLGRAVFHSNGDAGPVAALADVPTRHAPLTGKNLEQVLLASAAIPLLVRGVSIGGDPGAIYRDAAIVDYHPHLPFGAEARLVLYPHFYAHLAPSWFDRALPFRWVRGAALDRTVVIAPSDDFVARLPGGARPSRRDAHRYPDGERIRRWRAVWRLGVELGDALGEMLESPGRAAALAAPL
jgi:hypothetical protein